MTKAIRPGQGYHPFKECFRRDYYSEDYALAYAEQRAKIAAGVERREELKRMWAIQLKVRNALLLKIPEQHTIHTEEDLEVFLEARERYYYRRAKMTELEQAIDANEWEIGENYDVWMAMEPPRKRKTALVDGFRVKIEREDA
jgi:hypothetical protein